MKHNQDRKSRREPSPARRAARQADAAASAPRPDERRKVPRLPFAYAVRLDRVGERGEGKLARAFTEDVSSRGLYVCAPAPSELAVGASLEVRVTVPHRVTTDGREIELDLNGSGRVVRLEPPGRHGVNAEDGVPTSGVAVEFDAPLVIDANWTQS
jgi:hypothetical protein